MIDFMETDKSRIIFRNLRGTFIALGFVDTWAPSRLDTHIYCRKYAINN